MKIGFIGFGEAAYEISFGLKQEGLANICAFDVMQNHEVFGPQIKERAAKSQVTLLNTAQELVEKVDSIFVAVPADYSYGVSESLKPFLRKDKLYVDLTASTPDNKKKIWENIKDTGVKFVDAAMMGPLPLYKLKVPILSSGNGAQRLYDEMTPFGMVITVIGENPGDASAIKLLRSIYLKGSASLLFEMLEAAYKLGVEDQVIASLSDTLDRKSFAETMNRLVTGTAIHAQRRGVELSGSVQMLNKEGIDSGMSEAAVKKHESIAALNFREKFEGRTPKDWREVISIMVKGKNS